MTTGQKYTFKLLTIGHFYCITFYDRYMTIGHKIF